MYRQICPHATPPMESFKTTEMVYRMQTSLRLSYRSALFLVVYGKRATQQVFILQLDPKFGQIHIQSYGLFIVLFRSWIPTDECGVFSVEKEFWVHHLFKVQLSTRGKGRKLDRRKTEAERLQHPLHNRVRMQNLWDTPEKEETHS